MYYNSKRRNSQKGLGGGKIKTYYTAEEAMKKLGLPRSTFHHLVRKGEIPKIVLPLRKQAVYPKQEIDKIAKQKAEMLAELETTPEHLAFVLPSREDLEQLLEIERICYPEETLFEPSIIEQRMHYNPNNIHVLKNTETNMVLGSVTMSPMRRESLEKLINLEIDDKEVPVEDYLPFTPGEAQDIYIMSIIARPLLPEKFYAGKLLVAVLNYLKELLDQGVRINKIYSVATTRDGEELALNFQFSPLNTEWTGEHEEFRHSYVLDLHTLKSKHKLVKDLQSHMKNLERRKKRYAKQGLPDEKL
jgi:hypothetical protein